MVILVNNYGVKTSFSRYFRFRKFWGLKYRRCSYSVDSMYLMKLNLMYHHCTNNTSLLHCTFQASHNFWFLFSTTIMILLFAHSITLAGLWNQYRSNTSKPCKLYLFIFCLELLHWLECLVETEIAKRSSSSIVCQYCHVFFDFLPRVDITRPSLRFSIIL